MSQIKEIAGLLKELDDQLSLCMRCGTCQSVCPVFEQTGREADVARGKLALLDGLIGEMFKNPENACNRISKCLLCGSCADNCPGNVNSLEIFIKARTVIISYIGLSMAKKLVLRGVLVHPKLFNRVMKWSARFQKLFLKPANEMTGTSCARFVSPMIRMIKGRHIIPLAEKPFHVMVPELNTRAGSSGIKAVFYPGCLIDKIFPDIAGAVVNVLNHHGVGVLIPGGFGCCGIPAISSGDSRSFNRLVLHNLDLLKGYDFNVLVTACATCTFTIKKIWPIMLTHATPEQRSGVERLAGKTMDINKFLVAQFNIDANQGKQNMDIVTYHDPCHLKKSLGISTEPRTLIKASGNYRLKEMPDADQCCGMGGSFGIEYYDISEKIGQRKRDNIISTGCKTVATGCPACMIQIADKLSQEGDQVTVKHPIEIYAESLKQKK